VTYYTPAPRGTRRNEVSRRVVGIPASGIRRFFDLIASTEGVISLGVGEPDFVTPVGIRNAAIHSIEEGHTHYTSNFGLPELREAVSRHLENRYDVSYDPARELLITTGVSEGLNVALQALLDPGDEVIGADPSYVAYLPVTTLAGGVFVTVPTTVDNAFKIRAEDVESRISDRTKAILIGYPANPTGAVMERDDLLALAELAERHDLFVISDEIYDRLVYGVEHTCFAALPRMRERTVLVGGFSKAYAMTGWRVGWLAARPDVLEAVMVVHQYVMMSAPTVAQYAALEALNSAEEDVRGMLAEYDRRRRLVVDAFNSMGLTCFEPRGAFFAFPNVSVTGLNDEEFSEKLLQEEKVAVVPGSVFGGGGRDYVRVCYAQPIEKIEIALERMRSFVDRHRSAAK
jgi:aminotransferase